MTACPYCGDDPSTPVLESYQFTLELQWPNPQNSGSGAYLQNSGNGRWRYKKVRRAFEVEMVAAWQELVRPPTPQVTTGKLYRVTLTRLWGPRKRAWDKDNLVAGAKPIVDALVLTGALVDDSERHARIHYQQRKRTEGGSCAVHVLIEVLDVPVAT